MHVTLTRVQWLQGVKRVTFNHRTPISVLVLDNAGGSAAGRPRTPCACRCCGVTAPYHRRCRGSGVLEACPTCAPEFNLPAHGRGMLRHAHMCPLPRHWQSFQEHQHVHSPPCMPRWTCVADHARWACLVDPLLLKELLVFRFKSFGDCV
eukprot:560410-Pelagomonas_calceolata.AAC.2